MTDRLVGVVVTFHEDMRVDDAQPLIDAMRLIRGVVDVSPVVSDVVSRMAEQRAKRQLSEKLLEALK